MQLLISGSWRPEGRPAQDPALRAALAAGCEAGHASAQAGGRTTWSAEDYNAACAAYDAQLVRAQAKEKTS